MSSCVKLFLDNYNGTYYGGQTIIGRLQCYFHSEKKVRSIHLKFQGRAKVKWTASEQYYDHHRKEHRSRSVTYSAEEHYFNQQVVLVETHGREKVIPAGNYTYPFQFKLMENLPSSFRGGEYNISYRVVGTVDRPFKFDYEEYEIFNVSSPIDLNFSPNARNPIKRSDEKTVCCFCCKNGNIELIASLAKSGFAVGEKILLSVFVSNMSNVNVHEIKIKLKQNIEYTAYEPKRSTRYDSVELARIKRPGIGANGENTIVVEIEVPPTAQIPNLTMCHIINASYTIYVEACLGSMHRNLDVDLPIELGHVPLTLIGGPETIIPQSAFTENSVPLTSAVGEDDFVFIDHAEPHVDMPIPYNTGSAVTSQPMTQLGGMPYNLGMPMPLPQSDSMPMPQPGGMSISQFSVPFYTPVNEKGQRPSGPPSAPPTDNPSAPPPSMNDSPYPSSPYPPSVNSPYPPVSGPLYPSTTNAPYSPVSGSPYSPIFTNAPYPPAAGSSSTALPPSYNEAMALPEKRPI